MNAPTTPTPREWPLIAALTALGAILRVWGLDRLGFTHFDEGMYAMAAYWVAQPSGFAGLDPNAALYAPPVVHLLNGLSLMLGYSDLPLILPPLFAGVAAIPLTAWIARRAFGPGAGVAAAALVTLSGAHVAFSRMALTDSLFLATWLLAMGLGLRFLERPGLARALALGLAVGLAQNTKYNGWLAGVVVGLAGLLGSGLGTPSDRRAHRRMLVGLAVAAVVSALCYLPWFRFVETHGGYAGLMAHQRGYLGRLSDWPSHLRLQLGAITALSGGPPWLAASWILAVLGTWLVRRDRLDGRRAAGLGIAGAAFVAVPSLAWWLGLAWLPWLLREARPTLRMLGVWWLVLSILTPAYHPYARLWLPLHAVGWVLAGGLVWKVSSGLGSASVGAIPLHRRPVQVWCATLAVAAILVAFVPRPATPIPGLLAPTDFFRQEMNPVLERAKGNTGETLQLLARPHAGYYLFLSKSSMLFRKVGTLDQALAAAPSGEWLVVDEAQLRESGDLQHALDRLDQVYERVPDMEYVETLSPVTLLDVAPEAAFGDRSARRCRWLVYRPRPQDRNSPR